MSIPDSVLLLPFSQLANELEEDKLVCYRFILHTFEEFTVSCFLIHSSSYLKKIDNTFHVINVVLTVRRY